MGLTWGAVVYIHFGVFGGTRSVFVRVYLAAVTVFFIVFLRLPSNVEEYSDSYHPGVVDGFSA